METELAWAAGFFDGEGNAGVNSREGRWHYLRLQIGQVGRETLDRFAVAVGAGRVTGPYEVLAPGGAPAQQQYRWTLTGKKAETVADLLIPYLSGPKRKQINGARIRIQTYEGGELEQA